MTSKKKAIGEMRHNNHLRMRNGKGGVMKQIMTMLAKIGRRIHKKELRRINKNRMQLMWRKSTD